MHVITHAIVSWDLAAVTNRQKKDRITVTLAGVLPDLDGFGAVPEILSRGSIPWFSAYHHTFGHNLAFGLLYAIVAFFVCGRRVRPALFSLLIFHVHLACDLVGSAGPDGSVWAIPYFFPFSEWELSWEGQWALNAWPNIAITLAGLGFMFWYAWRNGISLLELISRRADDAFVEALRRRFPKVS
jgi:hypothetical protein